jgi:MFS family permease
MSKAETGPPNFLDRRRIIAQPGFSRWLVPPAALSIHLAIGQAYAFSVFKLPLTRLIGITESASGDWTQPDVAWIFSIAIVFLGLSAAVFGSWVERAGPRKAMFASAACFCGGFLISTAGVQLHQIWMLYLGYGVLGGIGLGLGYISPVSTLIKWFPDRPGMATGMAIMGFGGGAMIGAPLSQFLMDCFRSPTSTGVAETFATMGFIYFGFMMFGVLTVRLPPPGWKPPGEVKKAASAIPSLTPNEAMRTPQFWLLWAVLLLNVTAGIGLLEQASPMIQEMFPERVSASAAAGFVGLLSLFNMLGRFVWSSTSDAIGRKPTYAIFFALGAALYALTPQAGRLGNLVLFVACYAIIMSMYGGGFATVPAYLRDQFGTARVGAIHGLLLTAWSLAGVAGPYLLNRLREDQIKSGVPATDVYTIILYMMAGLLVVGFVCNILVRSQTRRSSSIAPDAAAEATPPIGPAHAEMPTPWQTLAFSWAWVGIPLALGVWKTVDTSLALFR